MTRPDLSIVVVTHNGREMALRTLRSAHAALGPIRAEWFVVDAESTDGVAEAIEAEFEDVRVLRRANQGFAASNNVALPLAQGRYVLLLNPDVEIRHGTLAELVAAMDGRPQLGMASVVQCGPEGEFQPSVRRFPSPARSLGEALFAARWPVFDRLQELDTRRASYATERQIDWAVGAFLIARTGAVHEIGPLDEQFFLYSEEIDWCYRFRQAGWPVALLPTMTVTHHVGGRSRGDLMAQLSHSRLIFAGKHYGPLRRGGIRAALGLGHAIRIGVWGPISRVRPAERGRVEAERAGLRVILGRSAPPLGPYAEGGRAAGMRPGTMRPADDDERHYLEERYREEGAHSRLMKAYYGLKPLLPRRLQIAMRRVYAKRQAATPFPHWPIEPVLVERREARLRRTVERRGGPVPLVADWPDGAGFAAILTHDVEGPAGVARTPRVIELERRHGFASSWNFVAEWYPIPPGLLDAVRAAGCEVGLHSVKHDGKLFKDRPSFEAELPAIHHYLEDWEVEGFRSPATHRRAAWMPELGARYDSSFPDTDPFEPQGGGCCSILPYFLDDLVELPITLVQDHTLWEILQADTIDLWVEKSDWIAANGGLVNLIVHPDYLDTPARLRMYEEYLDHLAELCARRRGWAALPREVAEWWRRRAGLRVVEDDGVARIVGPGAERATLAWATIRDEALAIDLPRAIA